MTDFSGRYAYNGLGYDLRSVPPTPMALSGVLGADGRGGFLFWDNTVSFLPPQSPAKTVINSDLLDDARAAGSELRYEVLPNCTMRIFGMVRTPFGPVPFELMGGLAEGGRKVLLQLGSPVAIGTWSATAVRRSFPPARR